MKYLMLIAVALLLTACDNMQPTWGYDQCARRAMMTECLAAVPTGPQYAQYNDWAEVVSACADTARAQAKRAHAENIKPECRGS